MMADAQMMEEELQQSVLRSEEDAALQNDATIDQVMEEADAQANSSSLSNQQNRAMLKHIAGSEQNNTHLTTETEEEEEDAEGEPDDEADLSQDVEVTGSQTGGAFDEDADAEGDADEDYNGTDEALDHDDDEVEEAEGVGAVKFKPGETDEDDESESQEDASYASDNSDDESNAEWHEEPDDNEEEEEEDNDEESVDADICMFCKKDEEHDPSDEFETYLACAGCGEHAHQQCARDAKAIDEGNGVDHWRCPDCVSDEELESETESTTEHRAVDGDGDIGEVSPASTRRSTTDKIARDLLPSHRGVNKPDSHSVFNQLVLDEDPMDGSRVLRKRKTSSADVDAEESMSLRKRRKSTSDGSVENDQDSVARGDADGADEATRPRSARSLRLKISNPTALCTVMKKSRTSLLVKMRVAPAQLNQILSQKPKPKKHSNRGSTSRYGRSSAAIRSTPVADLPMAPFASSTYTQPFYSFYDKETDELKGKPYGGILTEAEADTSKTLPTKDDRRRFDEAKQKADEEWRNRLLQMQAEIEMPVKRSKKASGPASQIECIEFGGWEIDTWYAAPYPEEYSRNRELYICEFCLKYMNSDYVAWRHKLKCPAKHPPGDEIYRQGSISFFEVDGRKNPVYCQNLCLLAKLFLGSKTLYYDVEPFLFYVLCEYDDLGYHFVGYFSKEKRASSQNNVSCILTLPIHQRKGYGNLLIDFSYLLTKVEGKTGSPEKPLSDMGLVSYRNYWRLVMCRYLLEHTSEDRSQKLGLSIRKISDETGMMPDDVISALEGLRCLVRDPQTQLYAFRVDLAFCREYVEKWESKKYVKIDAKNLTWTPYVMGRSNATNFEYGPALNAIAPREEEEDSKAVEVLAASGIATGDFADANGSNPKPLAEVISTVLESTEPNDSLTITPQTEAKPNGLDKEDDPEETDANESGVVTAPMHDSEDWMVQYDGIPAVRFEVFPPINTRRLGAASRMNSSIGRMSVPRAPATVPRSRPRRPAGSSRKSASRPKSSSTRRKTGGTGRGPGRWPKGTKKSDYGNADSGPGLPPAWIKAREQARLAALATSKTGATVEQDTAETVQVHVEQSGGRQSTTNSKAASMSTSVEAESGREVSHPPSRRSKTDESTEVKDDSDPDILMGEDADGDEDAEGDDE